MRVLSSMILPSLIVMSGYACSDQSRVLRISGDEYIYEVPSEYLKEADSIHYYGKIYGDKSKTVSLLIPVDRDNDIESNSNWEFLLLLFADKSYEVDDNLLKMSRVVLEGANKVGVESIFHHYKSTTAGIEKDYYLTFDPFDNALSSVSDGDYFIRMQREKGFQIDGFIKNPKPSCVMHSVFDGIALQLTTVGRACDVDNFMGLKAIQDQFLMSWRLPTD